MACFKTGEVDACSEILEDVPTDEDLDNPRSVWRLCLERDREFLDEIRPLLRQIPRYTAFLALHDTEEI